MIDAINSLTTQELLLNSTILAIVFRSVWGLFSEVTNRLRNFISKKVITYEIELGRYHPETEGLIQFNCLLIRHGTDNYIQALASEADKFDGKLQNKIIPIEVKHKEDGAFFILKLPVHERVGTQFKCFADVSQNLDLDAVRDSLTECEKIYDISKSSSQFKNRLYFLLKDFETINSIDDIENNMCYPV